MNSKSINTESRLESTCRRLVTIPLFFLMTALTLALLPALLAVALVVDLIRRRKWATVRVVAMLVVYFLFESQGILVAFYVWAANGGPWGTADQRWEDQHWAIQRWWGRNLFHFARKFFGFEITFEGEQEADLGRGPIIVFPRHVSIADTFLPPIFVGAPHKLHLRYVLKRELLWDPCLDLGGNRLPNYFVRRGSKKHGKNEVEEVASLAENLGPKDGVIIFPEGTRFSKKKRSHFLKKLAEAGDSVFLEKCRGFCNVMPPRLGGALALLQRNRNADLLFIAHVGFERITTFKNLLNGALVGAKIKVRYWRVPFDSIPATREECIDWLFERWSAIDQWVGEHLAPAALEPSVNSPLAEFPLFPRVPDSMIGRAGPRPPEPESVSQPRR